MPQVQIRDGEYFDVVLRRFKKLVEKSGVLAEVRARETYEKPTTERKRKMASAMKRHYRKIRMQNMQFKRGRTG